MEYINIDPTYFSAEPEFPLGTLGTDDGGKTIYEYVRFNDGDGNTAAAAGQLVVGLDSEYPDGEVTNDNNSNTIKAILNDPRGFLQAVVTNLYYCWVQCWGRNVQDITTDNGVGQNERLMPHATTTGGVDTHDAAAKADIGVALEADGTTTSTILDAGQARITIRC